jgi:hypothetical protein
MTAQRSYKIKCDQCCAYSINGHAVHEASSCPNDRKSWVVSECGEYVIPGELPEEEDYDDTTEG